MSDKPAKRWRHKESGTITTSHIQPWPKNRWIEVNSSGKPVGEKTMLVNEGSGRKSSPAPTAPASGPSEETMLEGCSFMNHPTAPAQPSDGGEAGIIKDFEGLANLPGKEPIRCSRMHFADWLKEIRQLSAALADAQREIERLKDSINHKYWEAVRADNDRMRKAIIRLEEQVLQLQFENTIASPASPPTGENKNERTNITAERGEN